MTARPPLPPEHDANQKRASDPAASAWVSASAGTGKTEVLVRRALRLLLAGSAPESILCLTYTKTAAAEMQNRLLGELANWATANNKALTERLVEFSGQPPDAKTLRLARRLFARALEAKGGLKIHTIHGFCERLLQRFPLEAQVTPHFVVLDEHEQASLKRAAFHATLARAAQDSDGPLGLALAAVLALTSGDYVRQVIETVMAKRDELAQMAAYHDGRADWAEAERLALRQLFRVGDETEETLIAELASVMGNAEIDTFIAAFAAFGPTTKTDKAAEASLQTAKANAGERRAAAFAELFLTKEGKRASQIFTKSFADAEPALAVQLESAQSRFAALSDGLAHLRLAEASAAVIALADSVRAEYERLKLMQVALDYDDLIVKAQNLLLLAEAASWVLYKIDGGIDHILVDEAQDTNPAQWTIIENLAAEFFAGAGRSGELRTLFAVGDEKQSIYSFQGANPNRFGEVGRSFRRNANALSLIWHDVPLTLSFRSTEPVLEAVDAVFARAPATNGLIFAADTTITHQAYREGQAGLVELWTVETQDPVDCADAFEPWNEALAAARSVDALASRIATTIKTWLDQDEELPAQGRKIRAGDILILVRRREPFTAPMIRALKRLGVPVAGADRMKLTDQIAVQDLIALADFLLMTEDDLALAVVLKSPLFDFNDDDLFALAHARSGSLWTSLKAKADDDPRFALAVERLSQLLARADFLPPYEFFSELLGADGGRLRKRMLTRLGPEAAEAIDEFLDRALAFDRDSPPSLQGFLNELRTGDVEIKRDMEQVRDEVRIMTVHGAKGLEAPIVFLPDTCSRARNPGPRLYSFPRDGEPSDEAGHLVWPPPGHSKLSAIDDSKRDLEGAEREEYHRLLYVGMTRARDRLYICGWEGTQKRETGCWYDLIEEGLGPLLKDADASTVGRLVSEQTAPVDKAEKERSEDAAGPLPDWALATAPKASARPKLAPSRLTVGEAGSEHFPDQTVLGPRALGHKNRYARGRLVHALLQHLPEIEPGDQAQAAQAFVAARGADLTEDMRHEIVAETLAIVRDPIFAPLFQPGSLAEVPVVARIGDYDLEGQIDRLAVVEDSLLIVDYKTNRPSPTALDDVSPAYLAQLAGYRKALKAPFAGRPLRAALLWTDGPRLMEIPSTSLDAAERRLFTAPSSLDGLPGHT
jgi:ATP-dependent helicase/nuclease subunit A